MGNKTVAATCTPSTTPTLGLLRVVARARCAADSLVSARQIRQPIESNHDIRNAFDSITYRKGGGGARACSSAWLGEETFREGIREYLNRHRFGTGDRRRPARRARRRSPASDVGTPFRTFLIQPGVPLVQRRAGRASDEGTPARALTVALLPGRLRTESASTSGRSRSASATRTDARCDDQCELVTRGSRRDAARGRLPGLGHAERRTRPATTAVACPPRACTPLMERGWSRLERARAARAWPTTSIAAFDADTVDAADVFGPSSRVASDDSRAVGHGADVAARVGAHEHLVPNRGDRPRSSGGRRRSTAARARRLGWSAAPSRGRRDGAPAGRAVISFLAFTARDDRGSGARRRSAGAATSASAATASSTRTWWTAGPRRRRAGGGGAGGRRGVLRASPRAGARERRRALPRRGALGARRDPRRGALAAGARAGARRARCGSTR